MTLSDAVPPKVVAPPFRAGLVALLGRPNVGKSTLLNRLIGQKLSITAAKAQTTRMIIRGVDSGEHYQAVYLDAPGILAKMPDALHRQMQQAAVDALLQADILLFVLKSLRWTPEDDFVLQQIRAYKRSGQQVFAVVNFSDAVRDKKSLLPFLQELNQRFAFAQTIPLSALRADNVEALRRSVVQALPVGEAIFPPDTLTDCSMRTLAAEFLREQCLRQLHAEVPHRLLVQVEEFQETPTLMTIQTVIFVPEDRYKSILLGSGGEKMRAIATAARLQMEKTFQSKVMLKVFIKVRENWFQDAAFFRQN
jgi:GTP-binding protein Era